MSGYELVFIVQPELEQESLDALVQKITETISDLEGQVEQVDPWGKRRLAYPIQNYSEAFYYLMQIELPRTSVRNLERNLKLTENVIRHLVLRIDGH
ncbi:MAG: hypothetical protein AMJ93_13745 [Anaerolineae bacterium SM23_84]|nr:MAG: hypothetical protein AMJ93_13745 [Anaerolineae bacterium SM23_84]